MTFTRAVPPSATFAVTDCGTSACSDSGVIQSVDNFVTAAMKYSPGGTCIVNVAERVGAY